MVEHKLILGGEQWLPFARRRVSVLAATGLPYASQQFEMPDGASVKVRLQPGHAYIALSGGGAGYQFFSTTPVRQQGVIPGTVIPAYKGLALRTTKSGQAKALASTLGADTQTPPRWKFTASPNDITLDFPRKNIWQVQGIPEHAFYARKGDGSTGAGVAPYPFLVDSWSSVDPLQTLSIRGGVIPNNFSAYDVGYDVAPSYFADASQAEALGPGLAPDADFYKRAAFRTVTHPQYGSRTFIVMSDISGVFHAYPLTPPDNALRESAEAAHPGLAIKTNVPEALVRRQLAPLPAWARAPTMTGRDFAKIHGLGEDAREYEREVPQYRWAFNSTATRACCVVYEDIAGLALNDPAGTIPPVYGDAPLPQITESLPGLVELALTLELTGERPQDFAFSVALASSLQPTVRQQYVMAADYAWRIKDAAALDDLVLLVGAIYHPSDKRISSDLPLSIHALKATVEVRNQTQAKTLRTFVAAHDNRLYESRRGPAGITDEAEGVPYAAASALFLSFDLRILAFVVQQRYQQAEYLAPNQPSGYFGAAQRVQVYAYNRLAQETWLDPDSPLNAALGAAFDDPGVAGLFKYPLDDVGVFPDFWSDDYQLGRSVYTSFDILAIRGNLAASCYFNSQEQFLAYGGPFNAGPYLYATKLANLFQLDHKSAFAVHPDGHWSVVTDPIFHYSGSANRRMVDGQFDLAKMRQTQVDILHYQGKDGASTRRTHLDVLNSAFGTNYTRADFGHTFSLVTVDTDWTDSESGDPCRTVDTYLKAQGATPDDYAHYLLATYSLARPDGPSPGSRLFTDPADVPAAIDARSPVWTMFSSLPEVSVVGNLSSNSVGQRSVQISRAPAPDARSIYLAMQTPVLRGSCLFY